MSTTSALEAGPLLDDEIYRLVFGDPDELDAPVDAYSKRINFAWDLVIELRNCGWLVRVQEMPEGLPYYLDQDDLSKTLDRRVLALVGKPRELIMTEGRGYANDAPLAICRAIVDASTRTDFRGFKEINS